MKLIEKIKPRYIKTELGLEKYCKGCDEYYPATKEFFFGTGRVKKDGSHCLETLCKACYKEKYNTAAKLGFTVLRYSTEQVKSGLAVKEIKQMI